MIKLNSSRVLEAVLAGAVATVQPAAAVGYNDKSTAGFDGDSQLADLNGATAVTICAAPASGAIRHIDYLTIRNYDSAQVVVTVRVNEGGTLHNIIQATLETGEMLGFTHSNGWYVNTADGSRKSGAVQDLSGLQVTSAKNAADGYPGLLGYGIVIKDAATGLVASLIDSLATVGRGYHLPDKSGTFAMTSDVITDHTALSNIGTNTHAQIDTHIASTANPHGVTAAQAGAIALTDLDTDGTLAANSDAKVPSQKAVKTAINALLGANDAEVYKGIIDCSTNPNYPAADAGQVYRVSVAGKIGGASGINVEVNDRLQCITDGTLAGNQAAVGANWWITQANIDGAVVGPASATDAHVAVFDGATGKLIKDGGAASSLSVASAASLTTPRNIDGQAFNGSADITVIAPGTHAATGKTTPVDTDELPLIDSAASNVLKKLTWANLKAALKTYFDSLTTTLTNKRITARVLSEVFSATPTINTDSYDEYHATAMSGAITSMSSGLTGTPVTGDILVCEFTDNGTARAITWGASFESSTVTLPITTVISALLTVTLKWNAATSKWRCVGVA